MALSPVFHSINSPDNSPLSLSILPVLFLPYCSFQLNISLCESLLQPCYNPLWLTGLKTPTNELINCSNGFKHTQTLRKSDSFFLPCCHHVCPVDLIPSVSHWQWFVYYIYTQLTLQVEIQKTPHTETLGTASLT